MIKKTLCSLLFSLFYIPSVFSFTVDDFPDSFYLKNIPNCAYSCVRLLEQEKQIGSMKSAPNKKGTFYFFDAQGQHQVSLKLQKIYFAGTGIKFGIFSNNNRPLGTVIIYRNRKSGQLIRFEIYGEDNKNPLIVSNYNGLVGTKHKIYLGKTYHVLAEITRPLFTYSRDSDAKIIDKATLLAQVDPNVFAAVLSFYCSEYNNLQKDDDAEEVVLPVGDV